MSGGQVSEASSCCSPSFTLLSELRTPPPSVEKGKIVFHETGPWYQGWGPLQYMTSDINANQIRFLFYISLYDNLLVSQKFITFIKKVYCLFLHKKLLYFSDYKMYSPQIWEENWGSSYSLNVAYQACGSGVWGGGAGVFFSNFPPLKPRCILLWSGASYSLKNTVP